MTDRKLVSKYFNENSKAWVETSYESDGYGFPTALARARKTISVLEKRFPSGNVEIVDLGCGAGQLCFDLAMSDYRVIGVDESAPMLAEGSRALASMTSVVQSRVRFVNRDVLDNGLEGSTCDAVTSLGVIGYLPNDDDLFSEAARLLRPRGIFIVSCRNRLFNMVSMSDHTLREIERGTAADLVEEIRELLQQLPDTDTLAFLNSLASASKRAGSEIAFGSPQQSTPLPPAFTSTIEARQHTPRRLLTTAKNHGFHHEGFYGVHPHLLMAGLNPMFPPNTFNALSNSLDTLDHLPISLIWSSVFIGVFRKMPC